VPSTPQPLSYQALYDQATKIFVQLSGVTDLNQQSVIRNIFQATSLADFKTQGQIIAVLNVNDIDRAEDNDLDQIGLSEDVPRPQAKQATGTVTVGDSAFQVVATQIYAGAQAPPAGSLLINIASNIGFPQTGKVYLGRGSNNVEGPLPYTSITSVGNYFQLTLSTPTTKNHNLNESVVLSQGGDRVISSSNSVQTPQNITSPSVTFNLINTVTLQDGENTLANVPVVCTVVGASTGNVSAGVISQFTTPPFPTATVTNPLAFVTGADKMADPAYRLLIKNTIQSRSKGTDLAIETASVGVQSTDDNQTVASATVVRPANLNQPGTLYIDNGQGYEPIFIGQGFEQVVTSANGGEQYFQLQNQDITKALLQSFQQAPFQLTGTYILAVEVGGIRSEHIFEDIDFATQNAATTDEVVNSINADTALLFSARSSNNDQNVVLFAKSYVNEDLNIVAPSEAGVTDANDFLAFDTNLTYTLRLYKDDVLLIKDGIVPTLTTLEQNKWGVIASPQTLTVQLDQQTSGVTYTLTDADFVAFGQPSMSQNAPLTVWAEVLNANIAGIDAVVAGNTLQISSNKGAAAGSKITLSSPTLMSLMFGTGTITSLTAIGNGSDYALNRSTGQLQLVDPLVKGDSLTAGSKNTRGFLESAAIPSGSLTLNAGTSTTVDPTIWLILDDTSAHVIPNAASSGTTLTVSNPATNEATYTSSLPSPFSSVVADAAANGIDDIWVVITDDAMKALNPYNIAAFKLTAVTNSSFSIITPNSTIVTGTATLLSSSSVTFVRSVGLVQEVPLPSGFNTLTTIQNAINAELDGGTASILSGQYLILTTNTFALTGSIMLVGQSASAINLGFTVGQFDNSAVSHTAFSESGNSDNTIPAFIYNNITAVGNYTFNTSTYTATVGAIYETNGQLYTVTSTPTSNILIANGSGGALPTGTLTLVQGTGTAVITYSAVSDMNITSNTALLSEGAQPNDIVKFLNQYGNVSSNKTAYTQIQNLSGTTVDLTPVDTVRSLVPNDRFYVSKPFDFTNLDNLVVIMDDNPVNSSVNITMARHGTINSVASQDQFTAYDADAGPTANYATQFGNNFSFNNFKIWFKARQILTPAGANNAMMLSSVVYGPNGQQIQFGIAYPTAPNSALSSSVTINQTTNVLVNLASGSPRLGGGWDATTQFDITNPTGNIYRFTWNSVGSAPNFLTAGIVPGDLVNIAELSNFENHDTGVYVVSAVTSTYFEITNPDGVIGNNIQLTSPSNLVFYPLNGAANTAALIGAYINANLANYLSAAQLQSGAGVIATSTYDDNMGSSQYVDLVDGENWILLSDIGTTSVPLNQFTLKNPMNISISNPFYSTEDFFLIPTTAEQIVLFLNVFSVTGLSSIGNIVTSSDDGKIQIYSNLFGTSGSVQVTGGSANAATGPLITTGSSTDQANIEAAPFGATVSGGTATLFTTNRNDLSTGDVVEVSDVGNPIFNGTFTLTNATAKSVSYALAFSPPAITGASRSSGIATYTTASASGLVIGDVVTITITGPGDQTFAGTYTVTSTPTPTTFAVNSSVANPVIAASPTGAVRASGTGTVTYTTTSPHQLTTGDGVTIVGNADNNFNGVYTVTSTPTTTTFTVASGITDPALFTEPLGATRAGGVITFTTASPNVIVTGDQVNVEGNSNTFFNGPFNITATPDSTHFQAASSVGDLVISSISRSGSVLSITTALAHNINSGDSITVTGAADSTFNGTYTVSTIPTSFTLTAPTSFADVPITTAGIATAYDFTLSAPASITEGTQYTNNGQTFTVAQATNASTSFVCTGTGDPTSSGTLVFVTGSPSGNLSFTSESTTTASITTYNTTAPHNLTVNDVITITGSGSPAAFYGTFTVATTPTANQFTVVIAFTSPVAPGAVSATITNVATTGASITEVGSGGTGLIFSVATGGGTVTTVTTTGGTIGSLNSGGGVISVPYGNFDISATNILGLDVNQWLEIQNAQSQPKNLGFGLTTSIALANVSSMGQVTVSGEGSFQTKRTHSGDVTTKVKFEKQGQFVCVSWTGVGTNPNFTNGGVEEGDWVQVYATSGISSGNQGIFKIEMMFGSDSFYITNANVVEEEQLLQSNTTLQFYNYDSVMPGDQFVISTPVLGSTNRGTYTVQGSISGTNFPTPTVLTVLPIFPSPVSATPLGVNFISVVVNEANPFYAYRKIVNMAADPSAPQNYKIVVETDNLAGKMNASAGATFNAMSKLAFNTNTQTGEDSYKYYGGLIHAVGQVIRGLAEDPINYPGIEASGAYIEIEASLKASIMISIAITVVTGTPFVTVQSRVQSAVAGYINSLGVGQSVVFSEIVSLVQQLNGVASVAISSPLYDANDLQIVINQNQKAVVTTPTNIIVSQAE
jgi:hypothetical protein